MFVAPSQGSFFLSVAVKLHTRSDDCSELPGKPLVCFRQKYSGSSSALPAELCWQWPANPPTAFTAFFGRCAKIIFSAVLNSGYVSISPYISNAETVFKISCIPQLIEYCPLTHCDGRVAVRLFDVPHQACHPQIRMFHSRHKSDAFTAHLPLLQTGFQSYSVGEASPCFRLFLHGTDSRS